MARPAKRKRRISTDHVLTNGLPSKRKKGSSQASGNEKGVIEHPVLSHYYPRIQTLRNYMIAQLPSSSRLRRRKVAAVGVVDNLSGAPQSDVERSLRTLLDTTLVGIPTPKTDGESPSMGDSMEGWKNFSQRGDESYVTLSNGIAGFAESQALIVEYVVRTMFSREKTFKWPDHLLCDGFRRDGSLGLRVVRPNHYVEALQQPPWPQLLALLGEAGDRIMIGLLLDCAIFKPLSVGVNNVCQISGKSLSNTPLYRSASTIAETPKAKASSELFFVRTRMFYAKPVLNTRGQVQFGLRHIHVLNRSPFRQPDGEQDVETRARLARQNEVHTLRVMMYMFPRQFGLHNVFTTVIDRKETSQRLKDYTLREEEIFNKFGRVVEAHVKTPKRLRGYPMELVRKLQVLHQRCSYSSLLQHYCPARFSMNKPDAQSELDRDGKRVRGSNNKLGDDTAQQHRAICLPHTSQNPSVTELATLPAEVSAYCKAVLAKVIPQGFWGCGPAADHNRMQFLEKVEQFISLRRFENMSLRELSQGMKISRIDWLAPPRLIAKKMSLTDAQKRTELFDEFLYFLFDTIVIPLVRNNFYVTESNTDKYRIFYFRHDVWKTLVEPAMTILKGKMLEEVSLVEAGSILQSRRLGFSHIRLLPKGAGMRPIMNLRKRTPIPGNPKQLGPGINKILAPVHTVLQLEKVVNSSKIGSAMFSVGDIYKRIKPFKSSVSLPTRFYFAKADVLSAFDTIPQAAIVGLLDSIPQRRNYRISKYLEVGTDFTARSSGRNSNPKPIKKWPAVAIRNDDPVTFIQRLENQRNKTKHNTVFADMYQVQYETSELLQLVASHIQQNLIKVGKRYYRQKKGIPQGSILSSTLCNYFYADLEAHVLSFLDSDDCLLMRLIDDFLLVTTDKRKATRFIEVLHQGVPEYGVFVNPKKTLVNFDLVIDGQQVPKLNVNQGFPYCGTLIDTRTLNIVLASDPGQNKDIYNSLTVEFSRAPGQTFQRKVINAFKIQSHVMFFDTGLNSAATMLSNIHKAFIMTATKMWAYARCLPATKRPPSSIIIGAIQRLADTAYQLLVSKKRRLRYPDYVCDVKRREVVWLAYNAFRQVLGRRQSKYGETLAWLNAECIKLSIVKDIRHARVQAIV